MGGNLSRAAAVSNDSTVDLNKLFQIESTFIADSHNKSTDARGLGQITPIALKEWNSFNPDDQHIPDELFRPDVNAKISQWYVNKRIPQMLTAYGIPDTTDNRLASYDAGVGTLRKVIAGKTTMPSETINYIKKYRNVKKTGQPQ